MGIDGMDDIYREHRILATAYDSRTPGKYLASYEITKDGEVIARASVVNLFDKLIDARENAARIARERLDELLEK